MYVCVLRGPGGQNRLCRIVTMIINNNNLDRTFLSGKKVEVSRIIKHRKIKCSEIKTKKT